MTVMKEYLYWFVILGLIFSYSLRILHDHISKRAILMRAANVIVLMVVIAIIGLLALTVLG